MTTVFTVKFNPQSKPLTQRIQIAKARHNKKMKGAVVLGMTSLVIIFAVFLTSTRSFIQPMRLMSLQIRKMRRNVLNNSGNPTMKQYSGARLHMCRLIQDHNSGLRTEEMENPVGQGIVNRKK